METMVDAIDGDEVIETSECAVTGETLYTVCDDDGRYRTVDVDGEERIVWGIGSGKIVQCDPEGSTSMTNEGSEEILERASEIFAILPTGEVAAALTHGSIIAEHYNHDAYATWTDVGLDEAFKWVAYPSNPALQHPHVDAGRYATPDGQEVAHMGGTLTPVSIDGLRPSERSDARREFMELLREGDVTFPAPVLNSGSTLFTIDAFESALASMVQAEYEL